MYSLHKMEKRSTDAFFSTDLTSFFLLYKALSFNGPTETEKMITPGLKVSFWPLLVDTLRDTKNTYQPVALAYVTFFLQNVSDVSK